MLTRKAAQGVIKTWAHSALSVDVMMKLLEMEMNRLDLTRPERALVLAEKNKFFKQLASHMKIMLSSEKQNWLTPPYFLDIVREVGPIALDPCGNVCSFVRAWCSFYGPHHVDGLDVRWYIPENTVCFVNPEYGRTLHLWTSKMASEGSSVIYNGNASLIALIPSRTGTGYWEKFIWPFADAVCFWHGGTKHPARMCFYNLDGRPADIGATFDAAVVYFGKHRDRFHSAFSPYGTVQFIN